MQCGFEKLASPDIDKCTVRDEVWMQNAALCWFQTSLPLTALPLCRVIIACCFRVAALSSNATLALSPSSIAPELRSQLSAICCGGQSDKVIDLLAWRCLPLGHPSVASGACAVVQISSSSERQYSERQASLKAALCWFQTSLPLAALPLPRLIIACCFRVGALSSHAALALSPSCIAPELNRIQLSAICRGGQSGKVDAACHYLSAAPSAASGACTVVQKSPSKRQCGERQASLKAALGFKFDLRPTSREGMPSLCFH